MTADLAKGERKATAVDRRAGASSSPPNDELPCVVWLRGHEEFFDDFSLTADQAMERLGIRRSRLTQISGRELRVGRVRDGRHIRPVYRPQDIDAYLEATRPTISHLRSSALVEEAAERLDKALGQVQQSLAPWLEEVRTFWQQWTRRQLDPRMEQWLQWLRRVEAEGQARTDSERQEMTRGIRSGLRDDLGILQQETVAKLRSLEVEIQNAAKTLQGALQLTNTLAGQIDARAKTRDRLARRHLRRELEDAITRVLLRQDRWERVLTAMIREFQETRPTASAFAAEAPPPHKEPILRDHWRARPLRNRSRTVSR